MKETAEAVKAALDETERAQTVAKDAIQLAQNNTRGTLDLLVSVSLPSTGRSADSMGRRHVAATTLWILDVMLKVRPASSQLSTGLVDLAQTYT